MEFQIDSWNRKPWNTVDCNWLLPLFKAQFIGNCLQKLFGKDWKLLDF